MKTSTLRDYSPATGLTTWLCAETRSRSRNVPRQVLEAYRKRFGVDPSAVVRLTPGVWIAGPVSKEREDER